VTKTITPTRRPKPSEQGYLLVSVMFMMTLMVIALAVAAPMIAKQIQRDRELETMHRGKQYARAVKLYYKKFGAYPASVDALVNTNEIRFLRKKYIDPTSGKEDWKVIRVGQNKTPSAMGFFGVPLNGAGAGGGLCGNALPSSTPSGSSSSGSSGFGSSGFSSGFSSGSSGSSFGATSPTAGCPSIDSSGSSSSNSSTDPNAAANGGTDPNAANGSSSAASQSANGANGTGTGFGSGQTGQTFGGAGIMGFSPQSSKQSILVYKKKNHYNEWEFVYDPLADQMMMQGGNNGALGGNPAAGGTGGIGGNGIGGNGIGGNGIGGSGIGSGSGFGSGSGSPIGPGSNATNPPQQ